jgi:GT2 family glycosyltransferase
MTPALGRKRADPLVVWTIILNWDGRDETLRCLRSLAAQTRRPDRVQVIDNGSQDGLEAALRREFPEAAYVRNPENVGYAAGVNQGFLAALAGGADLILTPNNDVVLAPDCLEVMLAALEANVKAGAVSPKIYLEGEPPRIYFRGGSYSPVVLKPLHHAYQHPDPFPDEAAVRVTEFMNACCVLYRSAALRATGLYDETYFAYYEDADLSRRLARAGWGLLLAPQARAVHADALAFAKHAPPGSGRTTPRKWFLVTRNQFWFLRRYGTAWQRSLGGAYLLVSRLLIASLLALRGRKEKAAGVLSGLQEGMGPLPVPKIPGIN